MSTKTRWFDLGYLYPGVWVGVAMDQESFDKALARLKIRYDSPFVSAGAHATTHFVESSEGKLLALVGMPRYRNRHKYQVAAMAAHEATHVWQKICEWIGEDKPDTGELEAYHIQSITQFILSTLWENK